MKMIRYSRVIGFKRRHCSYSLITAYCIETLLSIDVLQKLVLICLLITLPHNNIMQNFVNHLRVMYAHIYK